MAVKNKKIQNKSYAQRLPVGTTEDGRERLSSLSNRSTKALQPCWISKASEDKDMLGAANESTFSSEEDRAATAKLLEARPLLTWLRHHEAETGVLKKQLAELDHQCHEKDVSLQQLHARFDKFSEIANVSIAQWYWSGEKDAEVHPFVEANPELEKAFQTFGGAGTINLQSGTHNYEIDCDSMTQTKVRSGKERNITRREIGIHNADCVQVVSHVLAARLQEVEATQAQARRTQSTLEIVQTQLNDAVEAKEALLQANAINEIKMQQSFEREKRLELQLRNSEEQVKQERALALRRLEDKDKHAQNTISDMQKTQNELEHRLKDIEGKMIQEKECRLKAVSARDAFQKDLISTKQVMNDTFAATRRLVEYWKAASSSKTLKFDASSVLVDKTTRLFKDLSHTEPLFNRAPSRCTAFQRLKIRGVHFVNNSLVWSKYATCKEHMRRRHSHLGITAKRVKHAIGGLLPLFEETNLDDSLNEVFLAHGCTATAAASIEKGGFDIRYTSTNGGSLYGEGIYFTTEVCKCNQYNDPGPSSNLRHIIVARVVLGDPHYLRAEYNGRLPPLRDPAGGEESDRFDSNVVDPKISVRGQAHWEYVTFDGAQAYPEMIITYEL